MGIIMYKGVAYGGGADVTANPQDAATADLEKVKIDGTTYDVTDADAIHSADVGVANGVAELDANGFVPQAQLPSYVDDVLEYASVSAFPATGESGKIYVALDTNKTYRWSGSAYVEISESLALGETSSTAYRGDRGKTAYDHSQTTSGNPHNVSKTDVGLGNVPNVTTDNQTPTVTEASTRANLASGDTLKTIIGKIKKFFSDLGDLAFINKDGSSSTKFLQGDGTWQTFPSIPAAQVNSDWNATSGVAQILNKPTIPVIPSNNITGSGTNGKLTKWNGANSITDGPALSSAVSSQTQSTKFLREDGTWSAPSYTTNTDTKVTSSANHYSPSTASGQDKTASASGATAAWSIDVVKGVTLNTDGKGHVTGLSVTSGKVPANPNTDTKVTQTESTSSSYYEILMSETGSDGTTHTEGAKKTNKILAMPSSGAVLANEFYANGALVTRPTNSTGSVVFSQDGSNYITTLILQSKETQPITSDKTLYLPAVNGTLATREWVGAPANNTFSLGGANNKFKSVYINPTTNSISNSGDWSTVNGRSEICGSVRRIYFVATTKSVGVTSSFGTCYFRTLEMPVPSNLGWSSSTGWVTSIVARASSGIYYPSLFAVTDSKISFFLGSATSTTQTFTIYIECVVPV